MLLSRLTPTGRAVIACGQAGYTVGQDIGALDSTTTGQGVLEELYSTVGAVHNCSGAIDEARAADRTAVLSTEDLTVRAAGEAGEVERSGLTIVAAKLEEALGLAVKLGR